MSDRVRFIEHKSRRILFLDLSNLAGNDPVAFAAIDRAREVVASLPRERTLLMMVDSTGSVPNVDSIKALTELARHNTPWILASAVIGVTSILRLFLRIVTFAAGRKLAVFKTLEDGKEWLSAQWVPPTEVPQNFTEVDS